MLGWMKHMSKRKSLEDEEDEMTDDKAQTIIKKRFEIILSLANAASEDALSKISSRLALLKEARSLEIEESERLRHDSDFFKETKKVVMKFGSNDNPKLCREDVVLFEFDSWKTCFLGIDIMREDLVEALKMTCGKDFDFGNEKNWDELALNLVLMGKWAA